MFHFRSIGAVAVGLCVVGLFAQAVRGQEASGAKGPAAALGKHGAHFQQCAKVCADCMNRCEMNFRHCAELVAVGKKEHVRGMNLSNDCAELCAVAGKLSARRSDLAALACEACAKACLACAKECEHHADQDMNACALVCHECARVCMEMVKHARQPGATTARTPEKPK